VASKGKHQLDPGRLPAHVAIVMDGNGRWAKQHGVSRVKGHEAGAASVRAVIERCRELGAIRTLTLYAFSTENWRRSKTEVSALFRLLSKYIHLELDNMHAEDIRVEFIGRREGLPKNVLAEMDESRELTRNNSSMQVNFAVNYGAHAECVDVCRGLARDVQAGALEPGAITEASVRERLYDPASADLDLLIRTGGQSRLSNFMLWQASYAEFVVMPTLWPDFRKRHLNKALIEYQTRQRNFGGRPKR